MLKKLSFLPYSLFLLFIVGNKSQAQLPRILTNQVINNASAPKSAILETSESVFADSFYIVKDDSLKIYSNVINASEQIPDWSKNSYYSTLDFSNFQQEGRFKIKISSQDTTIFSYPITIQPNGLAKTTLPAILNFFKNQRADSPEELEADSHIKLFNSEKTVDLRGGWCDASGDVSKYFSHLAYTNFMVPQQIPLVTWSLTNTIDKRSELLSELNIYDDFIDEALYGADYIMRSLSAEGYFYMTVFSYFKQDPNERRVVGLLADSKTTADYQCAWREGAGMAIAALARVSRLKREREYTYQQYLMAAERAFAHAQANSTKYADDGKDNIIDDYCALLAATELWMATGKNTYRDAARVRSQNLTRRLTPTGYFIADDNNRPFWHASDAGLPLLALVRYLEMEPEQPYRSQALSTLKIAIDYQIKINTEVPNPFGYPRQTIAPYNETYNSFFIPHKNESGWWWQGEDARLGSLATAIIEGNKLVSPNASNQQAYKMIDWILGANPYNMCMMYGYGKNNVPYMKSMYGHGTEKGGISNGITAKDEDGSGLDFKTQDNGNEWRWSEQWIPHSAWFLQAITAMSY